MDKNRRKVLAGMAGGVAAAGVLCAGAFQIAGAAPAKGLPAKRPEIQLDAKGKVLHESLPYEKLDPQEAAERAYSNKLVGDCMYGVFATLVEMLAEKCGGPYLNYPTTVTRYGAGGIVGWASTCGCLNGAAMAIYLVSDNPTPIIDEVFNYAQYTPLPDVPLKKAKMEIKPSVAESTLCHVSVSRWCDVSGAKAFSPERVERCAQLAAAVTHRTVLALNAQKEGTFKAIYPIPEEVRACRACHDQGGELENSRGKMSCTACHEKHEL